MLQTFFKFIQQKPQHANPVFQLQISVIAFGLRHFPFCQNIPLVAGMDKMRAELRITGLLVFFDGFYDGNGILPAERFQGV